MLLNATDYTILDINQKCINQIGLPREEVLGKTCHRISHGLDVPCGPPNDPCPLGTVIRTGKSVSVVHKHFAAGGGTRYVEIMVLPLSSAGGKVERVIHISRDITEARLLAEELFQARKLEAIGKTAALIGHDIKNLIGAISAYVSLALRELPDGSPVKDDLLEIQRAEAKATGLLNELMSCARKRTPKMTRLNPNKLLSGLRKILEGLLGPGITLDLKAAAETPEIFADPGHIEEIFVNLAVNARDAMPGGGRLTISTSLGSGQVRGPSIEDPIFCETETCVIRVEDTGCGIPAEELGSVFDPLFTTKSEGKGTGLGLATVYQLTVQHRGRIGVTSKVGAGTAFTLVFPGVTDDLRADAA